MFENKKFKDIHATRYIMSWIRVGGDIRTLGGLRDFQKWMLSIGLNDEDIVHIIRIAMNGKLELEDSAEEFLKNGSIIRIK